ncbi:MAG: hypothetical protein M1840_003261 [Geoglossum simile]|nr:MAG: hypothetical protein M1840_003261 [Geoglossum simile]
MGSSRLGLTPTRRRTKNRRPSARISKPKTLKARSRHPGPSIEPPASAPTSASVPAASPVLEVDTADHELLLTHGAKKSPPHTVRQWEKNLAKQLHHATRNGEETSPEHNVTRHTIGTIIVERFWGLSLDELVEAPQTQRNYSQHAEHAEEMLKETEEYTEIPPNHTYIALDRNGKCLAAVFSCGLREVYDDTAEAIISTTIRNIEIVLPSCNSPPPRSRHSLWEKWKEDSKLDKVMTLSYGYWGTQGNPGVGPKISSDICKTAAILAKTMDLLKWLGNITKAINALFGVVDSGTRDEYRALVSRIPESSRGLFSTLPEHELFCLRVILVNLWTQPHRDTKDWFKGWAWLAVFGQFSGGDFCFAEMRRRVAFPSGAILGLRGGAIEHWTTKWEGSCRYCIVHTIHEYVRKWHTEETEAGATS